MNLEVRHLRLIMAVSEEKSITRAGNRLHLTQSALSHQLRDIEQKLGVRLFHRLNKRMVLTPAGEILLSSARSVLNELKQAEEGIKRMARGQSGVIRISTECYTCYHWLPAVLRVFNQSYPQVEVRIVVEATHYPLEALLEGRLDLAIVSAPVPDRRLRYEPLFDDELVVITSPDHPLALRPYITLEELAGEHLIAYTLADEDNTLLQKILLPAGLAPRSISRVQLTEAIIELVKAGLGVSVLARWAVAPHVQSGALAARALTGKGFHRRWSAAMINEEAVPRYLLDFVKLMARNSMPVEQAPKARRAARNPKAEARRGV